MRLTTFRMLAAATTVLVAAAATCLATFADVPAAAGSAAAPLACATGALAVRERETSLDGTNATTTFVVQNGGPACSLQRLPRLNAFDAAGNAVTLVPPKRIGYMRFVIRPLTLQPGARATFTLQTAHQGPACAAIAKLSLAFGDGWLDVATRQVACTRDDGSNVSVSFFTSDAASGALRTPAGDGASSRATPL